MTNKKILIAGGSGLIGSRLTELLPPDQYTVHILSRSPKKNTKNIKYFYWDTDQMEIDHQALDVDSIINLAGAGIADQRWSDKRKGIILESRIKSLALLEKGLKTSGNQPEVFVSASAIGFYGDRDDDLLDEDSSPGTDFLAKICQQWESKAKELFPLFGRTALIRIGIVLSTRGGALQKMLMTKGVRVLNYFGDGDQYYSWIHIDDLCNMMITILEEENYSGIYNGVSPHPMTNKKFMEKVANALEGHFLTIPAPAFALKLALGEMSAVVLNSNRVVPKHALDDGYKYKYESVKSAIRHLIENEV